MIGIHKHVTLELGAGVHAGETREKYAVCTWCIVPNVHHLISIGLAT